MPIKSFLNKKSRVVLVLTFSLFFLSLVSAAPPVQVNINVEQGIVIEVPVIETLQFNRTFTFSFHAFNLTNGLILDNTTTDCYFHLFNNVGGTLFESDALVFNAPFDFETTILRNNFSYVGEYAFFVHCNATAIGGFRNGGLTVTPTGQEQNNAFYFLILGIVIILILLGFWIKDPPLVILGSFGLSIAGLYVLLNGIVGVRDMVTTWAIGLIMIFVAAYIGVKSAMESLS